MARLIRFVRNAETELLVVTPFFTRFGVDAFVDHLAQATNRGVHVTVLTRDVEDEGQNAEHVRRIYETVADSGNRRHLSLSEYASDHGRLHAKALISDSEKAYVGSANFTNYSLKSAIEIGLIVQGSVVDDLVDFFAVVQASPDTSKLDQSVF
jgi:phosphatidylserine/phosphatidylglycerophosphate/cardiolipin synthase-like enzyme